VLTPALPIVERGKLQSLNFFFVFFLMGALCRTYLEGYYCSFAGINS